MTDGSAVHSAGHLPPKGLSPSIFGWFSGLPAWRAPVFVVNVTRFSIRPGNPVNYIEHSLQHA